MGKPISRTPPHARLPSKEWTEHRGEVGAQNPPAVMRSMPKRGREEG